MRTKTAILISFLSFFLGILILLSLLKSASLNEIRDAIFSLRNKGIILIFLFTFFSNLIGAIKWQRILNKLGQKITLFTIFSLYQGVLGIAFFLPFLFFPSQFLKSFFLKKNYSTPKEKSLASILIDIISEWTIFVLLILIALFIFLPELLKIRLQFLIILFLFLIAVFIVIFLFYILIFKRKNLAKFLFQNDTLEENFLYRIEKEIKLFFLKKSNVAEVFLLSILKALFFYLRTLFLLKILAQNFNYIFSFGVLGLTILNYLIPVPANVGVHETVQHLAFFSANLQLSHLLSFTTAIRTSDLLTSLLGIFLLIRFGFQWIVKLFKS